MRPHAAHIEMIRSRLTIGYVPLQNQFQVFCPYLPEGCHPLSCFTDSETWRDTESTFRLPRQTPFKKILFTYHHYRSPLKISHLHIFTAHIPPLHITDHLSHITYYFYRSPFPDYRSLYILPAAPLPLPTATRQLTVLFLPSLAVMVATFFT